MELLPRILGILGLVAIAVWYYMRKSWQSSPLQAHYNENTYKQYVGNLAQASVAASRPIVATYGQGWATTLKINSNDPNPYNTVPSTSKFYLTNI